MPVSPALLEQLRAVLVRQAGGYLRNVVREDQLTCAVCSTPCPGYTYCLRCAAHRREGEDLADQVACLTYAVAGQQAGYVMRGYKAAPPVEEHRNVVALTAILGLGLHAECAGRRLGAQVTHWATIPSLPARDGAHPLRALVAQVAPGQEVTLTAAAATQDARAINADHFVADAVLDGGHLLLIDDTWASGGHAQSAVLAGRRAGAMHVSVLAVARWIDPGWQIPTYETSAGFVRVRCTGDYDPSVCPWTGGACP
jgi:hypothetical protein